jgi:CRISPR-associated protein Cpf1
LIDREGNIMRDENGKLIQYSLNDIHGYYLDYHDENVAFTTPYQKLLDQRERENREAKESWGTDGKIKDLKAGYMSQVVSIISKLMVKHNAIVVLEDLNGSFKRGRQKVEKQVYQNFERALIQKLNYLVLKDVPVNEPGGLYNALQLADQFNGFQNLRKQSGFIFYVPAWKTSLIDPETGFVNLLKLKYESREKARNLIEKFECIHYNADKDWFEFAFDYAKLLSNPYGHKTDWVVCTHGKERYFWNPRKNNNKGAYEKVDVTASLKRILDEQGIAYQDGEDLRRTMVRIESADFYKELLRLLKITLDLRYKDGKGRDYILSPVSNDKGEFFSSLDAQRRDLSMPQDADANGAFNIARKGLFMLRSIDACEDVSKWDARLMPKEWVEFAQELCGNLE